MYRVVYGWLCAVLMYGVWGAPLCGEGDEVYTQTGVTSKAGGGQY